MLHQQVARIRQASHTDRSGTLDYGGVESVQSPVPAFTGVNYLLVTLAPGESWVHQPPPGHSAGWMAVASGAVDAGAPISSGEMAVFEHGEAAIALANTRNENAVFVLGSAVPHLHELHLGNYSVHTSDAALRAGERHIGELYRTMVVAGDRRTESGSVPVYDAAVRRM